MISIILFPVKSISLRAEFEHSLPSATVLAAVSIISAQVGVANALDVVGAWTASCGRWTKHQGDEFPALIDGAWLAGYLSAFSIYSGDEVDLPDVGARNSWVSDYCRNHPHDRIYVAADELILELVKRRSLRR